MEGEQAPDVIVFGGGRFGSRLVDRLLTGGLKVLVVDFDPEAIQNLRNRGIPVHFGDAEDMELIGTLPLKNAQWVVSALPEEDVNLMLLQGLREQGFSGTVAMTARGMEDESLLASRGATRVFHPYDDAADFAAHEIAASLQPRQPPIPLYKRKG